MNTLDQLARNYRTHRDRSPLPADAETIAALSAMDVHSMTDKGALMSACVSYCKGTKLHWHAFKTGPVFFVKLSTFEEYADLFPPDKIQATATTNRQY